MARTANLSIFRGEDATINFTAYTTDTGSTPQDITGWTLAFTVARKRNSTDKLLTVACSILVAASGTFKAVLADTLTDGLEPGIYFWDVWRTDSDNERCLGYGSFRIESNARIPA